MRELRFEVNVAAGSTVDGYSPDAIARIIKHLLEEGFTGQSKPGWGSIDIITDSVKPV